MDFTMCLRKSFWLQSTACARWVAPCNHPLLTCAQGRCAFTPMPKATFPEIMQPPPHAHSHQARPPAHPRQPAKTCCRQMYDFRLPFSHSATLPLPLCHLPNCNASQPFTMRNCKQLMSTPHIDHKASQCADQCTRLPNAMHVPDFQGFVQKSLEMAVPLCRCPFPRWRAL